MGLTNPVFFSFWEESQKTWHLRLQENTDPKPHPQYVINHTQVPSVRPNTFFAEEKSGTCWSFLFKPGEALHQASGFITLLKALSDAKYYYKYIKCTDDCEKIFLKFISAWKLISSLFCICIPCLYLLLIPKSSVWSGIDLSYSWYTWIPKSGSAISPGNS